MGEVVTAQTEAEESVKPKGDWVVLLEIGVGQEKPTPTGLDL